MSFASQPPEPEFNRAADQLARRTLLDHPRTTPMLVINGADDYFVPQADTLLFENKDGLKRRPLFQALPFRFEPGKRSARGNCRILK